MNTNDTQTLMSHFQSTRLCNKVKGFFKDFHLGTLANQCNIKKARGISTTTILYEIFLTPFFHEGLTGLWKDGMIPSSFKQAGKDTYSRFLANHRFHWRKRLNRLALQAVKRFHSLSSKQANGLILDDSTLPKKGKHIELVSWVFDSILKKSTLGFKSLLPGWSDGSTFIPFDFSLFASSNRLVNNQPSPAAEKMDQRTIGAKRRKDALRSKLEVALEMIQKANAFGTDAAFVLFDSWFAFPSFISKVYYLDTMLSANSNPSQIFAMWSMVVHTVSMLFIGIS